jgi:hypothetical protein
MRHAHTEVHWTIQDFGEESWSSLPIGVTAAVVWCAWHIHVSQLKKYLRVPEPQITMEDLDSKEDLSYQEYSEQEDQDVQGALEPSYRGRRYMEKRRRVQIRVSKFLFRSIQISGMRFILGGIGL